MFSRFPLILLCFDSLQECYNDTKAEWWLHVATQCRIHSIDRPGTEIWSIRGKFYGRAFENPRTNPEKERVWDAIIRINWFYKCYRGPGGCVYLLRVLRAAVVTCQWMNIKRNASKISFYEMKTRKNAMYYKRSYKYYVINYYYCYDYYLQWLLHHYRIIRRLNKLPKKKRYRYTYIWSIMHSGYNIVLQDNPIMSSSTCEMVWHRLNRYLQAVYTL